MLILYSSKLCAAHSVGSAAMLAIMSLAAVAPPSGWAQGTPINLTNNTQDDFGPVWSPDGTRIAFVSDRIGNQKIYVMNADGTNPVQLAQGDGHDQSPAWSPDGTKIAFVSSPTGDNEIYAMNTDGTNPVRLTQSNHGGDSPTWSPDGTKIVFVSNREGDNEIYVMNADGTNLVRLTQNAGHDRSPAWSPDGTKIAFVSNREGDNEIYAMNADGTNLVRLTRSRDDEHSPRWSPDGTTIAFVSNRDGESEIYVMNADGTNLVRLTQSNHGGDSPAWSPDGTKIAFQSYRRAGNNEIYVMNADGTNLVRLTQSYGYDGFPAWSPDGTKIAFQSNRDGDWEIYVMPSGSAAPTSTEDGDTRDRATEVSPHSTATRALEQPGDVDYFRLDVSQAGRLTVWTTGDTDTVGYLQNQEGRHLAGDDDAGPEANFEIVREVGPGTYYVAVVGGEGRTATGSYTLQVRFTAGDGGGPATDHGNTRAEATPVGVNTRTSAALERAGDIDYFRLEIRQAGTLTVETTGDTDTVGYFGAAGGDWLNTVDGYGIDTDFRIVWQVTPGTYYVAVVGGEGRTVTGHYTLVVSFTESGRGGGGGGEGPAEHGDSRAQATQVEPNTVTAGSLERSGDVDYFRVTFAQAGMLTVETTGDTDTVGYFGGADGRWLSLNDDRDGDVNFRIVRQVPAGTYYVAVVGGTGRTATGTYTFHVRFTADDAAADHGDTRERATRVEVNTQTDGVLDRAGDVDYFRVAVPRAGRLTVETAGTTDTFGYVGGASGGWLMQDDDGGTERNFRIVRDVAAGTYYVAVVGFNRTATGPYMLAVRFAAP